jgi:hypothetical protein
MRSVPFWDVTRHVVESPYRRFGTTLFKGQEILEFQNFLNLEYGTDMLYRNARNYLLPHIA